MAKKVYDNVWDAIGTKPEKAKGLKIRSNLMKQLIVFIRKSRFTQKEAAKFFDVSQPRISNLTQGKISLFTIDFLIALCDKAGIAVEISTPENKIETPENDQGSQSESRNIHATEYDPSSKVISLDFVREKQSEEYREDYKVN